MAEYIPFPTLIKAAGKGEKIIEEFIGMVNTGTSGVSIAWMKSPKGWEEPGQCPDFTEYTLVLKGSLMVKTRDQEIVVHSGSAIITYSGEWIRYSSPFEGGAEYIAVCMPAFTPESVHREPE
jgi:mannose-6-phosphate isomerase-like protein (cupin superfamily)